MCCTEICPSFRRESVESPDSVSAQVAEGATHSFVAVGHRRRSEAVVSTSDASQEFDSNEMNRNESMRGPWANTSMTVSRVMATMQRCHRSNHRTCRPIDDRLSWLVEAPSPSERHHASCGVAPSNVSYPLPDRTPSRHVDCSQSEPVRESSWAM